MFRVLLFALRFPGTIPSEWQNVRRGLPALRAVKGACTC